MSFFPDTVNEAGSVWVAAQPPFDHKKGDLWLDNSNSAATILKYFDGASWVNLLAGTAGGAGVTVDSVAPATPKTGDIWYDTNTDTLKVYNGAAWKSSSSSLALNDLTDVNITGLQVGQLLGFDGGGTLINIPTPVASSSGVADAGKVVALDPTGKLDSSMLDSTVASAGAGDAGKLVALDGSGKIDSNMVNFPPAVTHVSTSSGVADANKPVALNVNGLIDSSMLGITVPTKAGSADVLTGTEDTRFITSLALATASVKLSAGAADNGKWVRLDANGKLDSTFLPTLPTSARGAVDPTAALTLTGLKAGDMVFASKGGTIDASFTGAAGSTIKAQDVLIYDGTNWTAIPTTVDLTGMLTKAAADLAYLPLSGGTLTGNLTLSANPTADLHAATKKYVDDHTGITGAMPTSGGTFTGAPKYASAPTADSDLANKKYVDDTIGAVTHPYLPLAGGTLTGQVKQSIAPAADADLANKKYVDDQIAAKHSAAKNYLGTVTGGVLTQSSANGLTVTRTAVGKYSVTNAGGSDDDMYQMLTDSRHMAIEVTNSMTATTRHFEIIDTTLSTRPLADPSVIKVRVK